jgi:hypothetical protein
MFSTWGVDSNDGSMHVARGSSGVEEIRLEHCEVEETTLVALIESCRCLKSLIFRRNSAPFPGDLFILPLVHALREYSRETLENLELSFKPDTAHPGSLGPLRDFPQLKRISCPMSTLFASTHEREMVLPPSLTSLSLWIDPELADGGWSIALARVLESKQETVPLLEELCVEGYTNLPEEEIIQKACDAAQVTLTFPVTAISPLLHPVTVSPFHHLTPLWMSPEPINVPASFGHLPLPEVVPGGTHPMVWDWQIPPAHDSL